MKNIMEKWFHRIAYLVVLVCIPIGIFSNHGFWWASFSFMIILVIPASLAPAAHHFKSLVFEASSKEKPHKIDWLALYKI